MISDKIQPVYFRLVLLSVFYKIPFKYKNGYIHFHDQLNPVYNYNILHNDTQTSKFQQLYCLTNTIDGIIKNNSKSFIYNPPYDIKTYKLNDGYFNIFEQNKNKNLYWAFLNTSIRNYEPWSTEPYVVNDMDKKFINYIPCIQYLDKDFNNEIKEQKVNKPIVIRAFG